MKTYAIVLLTVLSIPSFAGQSNPVDSNREVSPDTPALLCADQADNRIQLFDPFVQGNQNPIFWSYPNEDEKPLEFKPTDAKRVEIDGVVHVLAAYHGRVQLVRFSDQKLVKDFSTYSSCHSAELLPDGAIVTASSNDGKLRLHHSADEFSDLDLPYAHGVVWDKTRKCLWALGDALYQIDYTGGKLTIGRKFELPLSPTGHDLFPLREEAKLLVSNNSALFLFDIENSKFEVVSELAHIKSASQHLDGSIWVSEPKELEGASAWQSDTVIRVRPKARAISHTNSQARFYKARWWQDVDFSY